MELTTSLLRSVERPGRYFSPVIMTGALQPPPADAPKILVVFPDLFEIARSHEGIKILRHLFRRYGAAVDYVFAFAADMEARLRREGRLISFLTGRDWRDFDLIAVSFQFQLQFPTFLRMLDVAGIPVRADERGEKDPVVMAGGPVLCNPEPMRDFIDHAYIGEVEPHAERIVDILRREKGRAGRIAAFLDELPPRRAIATDLNDLTLVPDEQPIFGLQTVHDRYTAEIQRGCTRGCRFCMAGVVYRPHRERHATTVLELLRRDVVAGGYREAGFLSLSAGDHSRIEEILRSARETAERQFSVSLPSLRVETLTDRMVALAAAGRRSGFTLAPESGSERLRRVVNKGNTTADLIASVQRIFDAGWCHLKLYFMLGLPGEEDVDIEETIALLREVCRIARTYGGRASVTASFSTFVPQPFTPFQWEGMASLDEIGRKQRMLIDALKKCRNLKLSWHNRFQSRVEGMLTRADRRIGAAIAEVARRMTGLQSWDEGFDFALWSEAVAHAGLSDEDLCGPRPIEEPLPYEYVDMGVTREFLLAEREKAFRGEQTPDCALGGVCVSCGVCDHDRIAPRVEGEGAVEVIAGEPATPQEKEKFNRGNATPWIFSFEKKGRALSIGHLDLVEFLLKGFTREKVAILYSEGFNPTPRFSLVDPLPVGVEAEEEYGVVWLTDAHDGADLTKRFNALYEGTGIRFHEFRPVEREKIKETERAIREAPLRYACRFASPDEARRFLSLHTGLDAGLDGATLLLRHPPEKGSVMKLFAGFDGEYHIVRERRTP
ncbi:MAG TPA: TIGR03936 family radical SAM-associated protein [bacterium]|nr:TIGR03936 family radical SAM-associated protein [bacterium]